MIVVGYTKRCVAACCVMKLDSKVLMLLVCQNSLEFKSRKLETQTGLVLKINLKSQVASF